MFTEEQLRQNTVDCIRKYIGATKGSKKHLELLSIYNGNKPLARGYAVQPYDDYCATTVSAVYIAVGIAAYTGTECGVEKYTEVAKRKGIWVENDAHKPKLGDACVYDWQDSGKGDCTGWADHIGIVTAINGNNFTVTEGNMSGGVVGTRLLSVNARYIRGYICPDFAAIADNMNGASSAAPTKPSAAATPYTHIVVAGDNLTAIARKYNTSVDALVKINGIKNANVIKVGQVIALTEVGYAIHKLATLKVIDSPDYWAGVVASNKVKYLDTLLINAAKRISKAGTRTGTYTEGLSALVKAGVINTPAYWQNNYSAVRGLSQLLCALGGAVK